MWYEAKFSPRKVLRQKETMLYSGEIETFVQVARIFLYYQESKALRPKPKANQKHFFLNYKSNCNQFFEGLVSYEVVHSSKLAVAKAAKLSECYFCKFLIENGKG